MRLRPTRGGRTRILYYSHTGLVSGAEHVLLNTLAGLDRALFEPLALCPVEGNLTSRIEALSIPVIPLRALQARFTSSPLQLVRYLHSFYQVISAFRSRVHLLDPDLIHANSVRAAIVATVATMGTSVSVVWHVHDDLPRHPLSAAIRIGAFLSRRSIFLAVSASTSRTFCGKLPFGKRTHVLHNGVDHKRFPRRERVDLSFRRSIGVKEDAFLICAVGMINSRKDLLGLVQAFKIVHDSRPNAQLAVVGEAIFNRDDLYLKEVRDQVEQLGLSSVVYFTGARSDVATVLRGCDLLVLNARVEPFGLVLAEAMSSGTPVLATCVGGIPEIITHKQTGFLVPPEDPDTLASSLLEAIAHPETMSRMASQACVEVRQRFSLERYNAEYQALLKGHLCLSSTNGIRVHGAPHLRVALFHDSFAQSGGAERVAEELHKTLKSSYRKTDLFSTLTVKERLSPYLSALSIRNTWMQWLPAKQKLFRAYFLFYPFAIDHANLSGYDLIVTSCFGYAKGVRRDENSIHICYCHTPMRWVWRTEDYLSRENNGRVKKLTLSLPIRWLKNWELKAASRPDFYIANSSVVANRLFRAFGIHAQVIPPPIDTGRFARKYHSAPDQSDDFYLILSRLVPYKRLDLAIEACSRTQRRLVVIGSGPDRKRLERLAGSTVTFLGRAPIEVVVDHAQRCQALLFPGEEDFGMTPLEVNAAGRPVVAYRGGGATETIVEGLNGVFFDDPTVDSMVAAIERLERLSWSSEEIHRHAQGYGLDVFSERIHTFIGKTLAERTPRVASVAVAVTA